LPADTVVIDLDWHLVEGLPLAFTPGRWYVQTCGYVYRTLACDCANNTKPQKLGLESLESN